MMALALLVSLFFFYSLVSQRLEKTIVTPPIVFTVAGMLMFPALPLIQRFEVNSGILSWLAEIGLVLLLFTDASRTSPDRARQHWDTGGPVVERWHATNHFAWSSRRSSCISAP